MTARQVGKCKRKTTGICAYSTPRHLQAGHLLTMWVAYDWPRVLFVLFYAERTTKTLSILTAMSLMERTLIRHHVGALPLIHRIAARMGLRALLDGAIQPHGNDQVPVVDTLMLLIYNLTLGKDPLYELPEWVGSIDRRVIGYQSLAPERFTDDRFARALDRLYQADRASLMTELVVNFCRAFRTRSQPYPQRLDDGKGLRSVSEQDRQWVRAQTRSQQGSPSRSQAAVVQLEPECRRCRAGAPQGLPGQPHGRQDPYRDLEHAVQITPDPHFLYVADSKLCTDEQLHYIVRHGGRAITIMPESWAEVAAFKRRLRARRHCRSARSGVGHDPRPSTRQNTSRCSTASISRTSAAIGSTGSTPVRSESVIAWRARSAWPRPSRRCSSSTPSSTGAISRRRGNRSGGNGHRASTPGERIYPH